MEWIGDLLELLVLGLAWGWLAWCVLGVLGVVLALVSQYLGVMSVAWRWVQRALAARRS